MTGYVTGMWNRVGQWSSDYGVTDSMCRRCKDVGAAWKWLYPAEGGAAAEIARSGVQTLIEVRNKLPSGIYPTENRRLLLLQNRLDTLCSQSEVGGVPEETLRRWGRRAVCFSGAWVAFQVLSITQVALAALASGVVLDCSSRRTAAVVATALGVATLYSQGIVGVAIVGTAAGLSYLERRRRSQVPEST